MTLPIARDLMSEGVRVNTILPGVFKTPMVAMMPPNVQDALGAQVPFPKRLGQAEEYARLALFMIENVYMNAAGGDLLFGDHGHTRCSARKSGEDDQLGCAVRFGHRRGITLLFDFETAPNDFQNGVAGFPRRLGDIVEEPRMVGHQRGAIRIPPSSRTDAAFM